MHNQLKLMKLEPRCIYHVNVFTYNALCGKLPGYICDKIIVAEHELQTRSLARSDLSIPRYRLYKTMNSFTVKCPAMYNRLDADVRAAGSVYSFRTRYFNRYGYI